MVAALLFREWTLFSRSKLDLWLTLLPSAVTLIFFTFSMSGAVGKIQGVDYAQFIIPGIAVMALIGNAGSAASRAFSENYSPVLKELFSLPVSKYSYVSSKILAATFLAFLQGGFFVVCGSLLVGIKLSLLTGLYSAVVLLLTSIAVSGIFLCIAIVSEEMSTFLVLSNTMAQIIIWSSTVFYPAESMPAILRYVSYLNPVSYATNLLREAMLGLNTSSLLAFVVLSVCALVASYLAGRLLMTRANSYL